MPNDNMLMISRALLQDLFDDVSDYACSREFKAKEKAWRDDLLARVRSLLTAYPGAPEMLNAHPVQPEPRAEVTNPTSTVGRLLATAPHFEECKTPEPSLSALIHRYYENYFERDEARECAARYIEALYRAGEAP